MLVALRAREADEVDQPIALEPTWDGALMGWNGGCASRCTPTPTPTRSRRRPTALRLRPPVGRRHRRHRRIGRWRGVVVGRPCRRGGPTDALRVRPRTAGPPSAGVAAPDPAGHWAASFTGDAIDLAAGEGRHALWLARRGWRVTAVDFSDVGLSRGRGEPGGDGVSWMTGDVTTWSAEPASADLVLVAYLHLPEPDITGVLRRAVGWLHPGGRLLLLGHDVENLTAGVGGPQDPAILHSVGRLAPVAALLQVDRLEQVWRATAEGTALDTLLWGRRTRPGKRS